MCGKVEEKAIFFQIARILSTLDQFKWMSTVVPVHINHGYSAGMSQKSQVFQLPIQHKNEAKYEDILDIMDSYEKLLQKTFQESHGLLLSVVTHLITVSVYLN